MRITFLILFSTVLSSCSSPAQKFLETANSFSFSSLQVNGNPFFHRLYLNQNSVNNTLSKVLHVYIDGDGTPWERNRWVASDPTSRNPVILRMMDKDNHPAILLGRPCYHAVEDPSCFPRHWTSHRYSEIVVKSMVEALNNWLQHKAYEKLILIGFSGGGTLAVLMVPHLQKVTAVITVAGNLDTARWSRLHGYLPLTNSLNPIKMPPLSRHIQQIHFAGLKDKNIPAKIINSFSTQQTNAVFIPVAEFNHTCCWDEVWSELLPKILLD